MLKISLIQLKSLIDYGIYGFKPLRNVGHYGCQEKLAQEKIEDQ